MWDSNFEIEKVESMLLRNVVKTPSFQKYGYQILGQWNALQWWDYKCSLLWPKGWEAGEWRVPSIAQRIYFRCGIQEKEEIMYIHMVHSLALATVYLYYFLTYMSIRFLVMLSLNLEWYMNNCTVRALLIIMFILEII